MVKNIDLKFNNSSDYLKFIAESESRLVSNATRSKNIEFAWIKEGKPKKIDLTGYSLRNNSFRTPFLIDYDMITYSKYFMKLSGKTQIFISPNDDQFITRSSHTDIVENISEGVARGLSLNEDLARAIAKGHDVGHTAFGHAGEEELDAICQEVFCGKYEKRIPTLSRISDLTIKEQLKREFYVQSHDVSIFSHARQSFRFLCVFEGKQLTAQTVYGIINHVYPPHIEISCDINQTEEIKRSRDQNPLKQHMVNFKKNNENYIINETHRTYESQLVKFADFLAYSIHDLDDALRAGKLSKKELEILFASKFPNLSFREHLVGSNRYSKYINDYIETNRSVVEKGESYLQLPVETKDVLNWIYNDVIKLKIHEDSEVKRKNEEGRRYIRGLYDLWQKNPAQLIVNPDFVPEMNIYFNKGYSSIRKFCDFISALTDNEIIGLYRNFYGPEK